MTQSLALHTTRSAHAASISHHAHGKSLAGLDMSKPARASAVDLFAGGGGFSTGARMAGVDVRWAANHWPLAVQYHAANHPETSHACQDLHQADWSDVPAHDILLASPCCQGHSRARGVDRPHHDAQRSTAWAVVSCAEYHRPEACVIENVPEFSSWLLYPAWADAMNRLGYSLSHNVVDSADHGVPQNRVRLFIVATKSKNPIQLKLPKLDHVAIGDFIDWEHPKWSPVHKPNRSPATLRRILSGRAVHGERFLAPYYKSGSGLTGRSIHRPVGTITTRARWAVIDGDRMRMMSAGETRDAMGFPTDYALPSSDAQAIHLLGNAVPPPVARDFILETLERV